MEAQRVKREEDRINRLEAEEVSKLIKLDGKHLFETVVLLKLDVDYLNLHRLKEEELMQLSKTTKMTCVAKPLRKQIKTCTKVKTWSKLSNRKCWCVMLHMSNKLKKLSEIERKEWKLKLRSIGKKSRNKKWLSMTRRWKRSSSKSMLWDKKMRKTLVTNLNHSNSITSSRSKKSFLRVNWSKGKLRKTSKGRNKKRSKDRNAQLKWELIWRKQIVTKWNRNKLLYFRKKRRRKRLKSSLDREMSAKLWRRSEKVKDSRLNLIKDRRWLIVRLKILENSRTIRRKYWTGRSLRLRIEPIDFTSSKKRKRLTWRLLSNEAELSKSKERNRKLLAKFRRIRTLQSSGESVMKNFSWQNSKRKKKKDREQRSFQNSLKLRTMPSRQRLSRNSKKSKWILWKLRHFWISKRRTSTRMLRRLLQNGKHRERMWSRSLWS